MSVGAVGAPRHVDSQGSTAKLVGGAAVGLGLGAATAIAARRLAMPMPLQIAAGLAVGGPIAAVALLNNTGAPSSGWTSAAIGAAPLALVGAGLGAFGGAWSGGKAGMIGWGIGAALAFGAVGAGVGAITHWATKPS